MQNSSLYWCYLRGNNIHPNLFLIEYSLQKFSNKSCRQGGYKFKVNHKIWEYLKKRGKSIQQSGTPGWRIPNIWSIPRRNLLEIWSFSFLRLHSSCEREIPWSKKPQIRSHGDLVVHISREILNRNFYMTQYFPYLVNI